MESSTEHFRNPDNFTTSNVEVTLRWLEACIEYAHRRRNEKLVVLLENVKSEVIFELGSALRRNGCQGGSCGENRRGLEEARGFVKSGPA